MLVFSLLRHVGILWLKENDFQRFPVSMCVLLCICVCVGVCVCVGHGFSHGICGIRESEQLFRGLHSEIWKKFLRPRLIIPSGVPLWWLNFEIQIQFDASRGGNSEVHTFHKSDPVLRGYAHGKHLRRLNSTRLSRLSLRSTLVAKGVHPNGGKTRDTDTWCTQAQPQTETKTYVSAREGRAEVTTSLSLYRYCS